MARPLRIEYDGAFYHVTARGNERKSIFFSQSDYYKFKEYLKEAQDKYGYLLHCYMLIPNHYHLLIETPKANLSKVMHYINASYTNYINRKRKRCGHLLQGRYKAILVDKDIYLLELSRYIHLNPIRAKIATAPEEYLYSSYKSYIFKKKEDIVQRDFILGMLSKNRKYAQKEYRNFVEKAIEEKLEDPLKKVYGGVILGSQTFIKKTLNRLKEGVLEEEDISHRRELRAPYVSDAVIDIVSSQFNVSHSNMREHNKECRNIAIYFLKKFTIVNNKQISELCGNISYSAVAKAYQRFSARLGKDKLLRKTVEEIAGKLSQVKT